MVFPTADADNQDATKHSLYGLRLRTKELIREVYAAASLSAPRRRRATSLTFSAFSVVLEGRPGVYQRAGWRTSSETRLTRTHRPTPPLFHWCREPQRSAAQRTIPSWPSNALQVLAIPRIAKPTHTSY